MSMSDRSAMAFTAFPFPDPYRGRLRPLDRHWREVEEFDPEVAAGSEQSPQSWWNILWYIFEG
jgi:hypothetical protein